MTEQAAVNINFYMLLNARTDQARIDSVYPDGTELQQGTNALSFVAGSTTYGINATNIHVTLNGVNVSSGLVLSGGPGTWNVSYPGLQPDSSYTAVITVTDNHNQTHTTTVNFDTFGANYFTWEGEDFDFDPANSPATNNTGLRFIDNPVPTSSPASNSYYGQSSVPNANIDYSANFLNVLPAPLVYRPNDLVPMLVTSDAIRPRIVNAQLAQVDPFIQDYDIFNLTNNAPGATWVNYTRTFPTGNFYLFSRLLATAAAPNFECAQLVNGVSNVLGSFQAPANANWQYSLLTNSATGLPAIVSLGGTNTLQLLGDGLERVNFFMLVPLPQVTLTAKLSGTNLLVSFPTESNHKYILSYRNNLTDSGWTPVTGGTVNGNGLVQTIADPLTTGQRFYRVVVQ
jgi:hypothetical protein